MKTEPQRTTMVSIPLTEYQTLQAKALQPFKPHQLVTNQIGQLREIISLPYAGEAVGEGELIKVREPGDPTTLDTVATATLTPVPSMNNPHQTKFYLYHRGDSSVGIPGEGVTVIYDGEFGSSEYRTDFVLALHEAFVNIFDNSRVTVIQEHRDTCRICLKDFQHFDDHCDHLCSPDCQQQDATRGAESKAAERTK